jgi:uncharacterized protein (DUF1800 family)
MTVPEARPPTTSLKPIAGARWGSAQARHLLWRAGFGGTPAQVSRLASLGPEGAVSALLDFGAVGGYEPVKPDDFDDSIMRPLSEEERRALVRARRTQDEDALARFQERRMQRERLDRDQIRRMQRWWLRRMIETPRPMEEKLTLFWHGHFATSYRTIENSYHAFLQNQTFRRHAAGNFGVLLAAIVRDPAMLAYLDNTSNRRQSPNENLARELMELFSLGEGNYTERDIREGARALTGYTFEHNEFRFRRDWHDDGQKTILGRSGNLDGEGFVGAILRRREASEFITLRLYRFFVGGLPPAGSASFRAVVAVVKDLARTLSASGYELRPMLRRLLLSEHFYDGPVVLSRIKSPAELVVGAVRSLGAPARDLSVLLNAMDMMGQNLFFPPSVKGWDGERSWINTFTFFVRQNITNYLLTGRAPRGMDPLADAERFDAAPLLAAMSEQEDGGERDPDRLALWLMRFALGADPAPEKHAGLASYLRSRGPVTDESVARALALITAMPEYQQC